MTHILLRLVTIFSAALALSSCAGQQSFSCPPGQMQMLSDTLYFGAASPAGTMSPEAWQEFLDTAITPRFPEGLSAWPANGQWKSAKGTIVREASYVLNVIHSDTPPNERAINEITAAFKARFNQESVLRVRNVACVSF